MISKKIKHAIIKSAGILFLCFLCHPVWGHPPSKIDLEYDEEAQKLKIHIVHIAHNHRKHFIRKIVIYKNDKEVEVLRLVKQDSGTGLDREISLSAEGGDKIRVKAICSEAGSKEDEITIPEESLP